jgi:hypothetical protein
MVVQGVASDTQGSGVHKTREEKEKHKYLWLGTQDSHI